jgi:flagellin-specific chaperone FliS
MGKNLASLYDWCIRTLATIGQTYDLNNIEETLKVTHTLHRGFCSAFGEEG